MRLKELIPALVELERKHGNLPVVIKDSRQTDTQIFTVQVEDNPYRPGCSNCVFKVDL